MLISQGLTPHLNWNNPSTSCPQDEDLLIQSRVSNLKLQCYLFYMHVHVLDDSGPILVVVHLLGLFKVIFCPWLNLWHYSPYHLPTGCWEH